MLVILIFYILFRRCCQWFFKQVRNSFTHFRWTQSASWGDCFSWFSSWFSRKFSAFPNQFSWGWSRGILLQSGRVHSQRWFISKTSKSIQSKFNFVIRGKCLILKYNGKSNSSQNSQRLLKKSKSNSIISEI